ncbi:MAG: NAD-binding protein [Candidatus Kerfeldbacteria bacterium]|nr:NAD-binding protein [Candidatus Kerfeldbacteria bacterium]
MNRLQLFLTSLVGLMFVGVVGLKLIEPAATWHDAVLWMLTAFATFGMDMYPPTSLLSKYFQTLFVFASFVQTGFALTIVIPPFLQWWEAPRKGLATIAKTKRASYLLVGPVDWEKVLSVYRALQTRRQNTCLVVMSETFTEIPEYYRNLNIKFVYGSLRQQETYQRAGIEFAAGVFVCSPSYQNPDSDVITSGIAQWVEQHHPSVRTVAEVVSRDNFDLFEGTNGVDAIVTFDPVTLRQVAQVIARQLPLGQCVRVEANVVDAAQQQELDRQLAEVGVQQGDTGVSVKVILPRNLDDPNGSDFRVKADLYRAQGTETVGMYLSVLSQDLFVGCAKVVCADAVVAEALVQAMLGEE